MTLEPDEAGGREKTLTVPWALLSVAGLAAASLVGWLEEVARAQAIEKFYGLPLTIGGDPRAAAAIAVLPLALSVAAALILVAGLFAAGSRRWWAGIVLLAIAGTLLLRPPRTLGGAATEAILAAIAGAIVCVAVRALRPLADRASQWGARRFTGQAQRVRRPWPDELRWVVRGIGVAAAIATSIWLPLWAGDHAGRNEAMTQTMYFVVADRTCTSSTAVLDFGSDGSVRRVRIARRGADGSRWTLVPGILYVSSDEPLMRVQLGRVAPSQPADIPITEQPHLPSKCS